jgi:hypothetical protein
MWRQADCRIHASLVFKEQQEAEKQEAIAKERRNQLETLHHAVLEALTKGCTVLCPNCNVKGEKDDKCMHIKCDVCSTRWCYCCGHMRRGSDKSSICKCDSISPHLESNPGWDNFAIDDETPGQGALHEFHRQRIMYLLRELKQNTDQNIWNELQVQYPDILENVPTIGRRIDWDSVESAVLPVFGQKQTIMKNIEAGQDSAEIAERKILAWRLLLVFLILDFTFMLLV